MIDLVRRIWLTRFAALVVTTSALLLRAPAQIIDYHQHLYSPDAGARSSPGSKGINALSLIIELDAAGIERAVVLSVAYSFSNPNKAPVADEYARVMAENDWTSAQIAQYPNRLIAFCSVNPLRSYALKEIARCAEDPNLRTGLKLHFGNSDVNLEDQQQVEMLRSVFRIANRYGMAITVHMHANVDHHRPYGARQARIFLEQLLPEAPDVSVQIAHLAGSGGYDDGTDQALSVFIEALQHGDPQMKNVYFDVCSVVVPGMTEEKSKLIVQRIRQIGVERILYGSDAATGDNLPKNALSRWHQLPLTDEEFRRIDTNVALFLKKWIASTASPKTGQSPGAAK